MEFENSEEEVRLPGLAKLKVEGEIDEYATFCRDMRVQDLAQIYYNISKTLIKSLIKQKQLNEISDIKIEFKNLSISFGFEDDKDNETLEQEIFNYLFLIENDEFMKEKENDL
jgi:hypothetical protein